MFFFCAVLCIDIICDSNLLIRSCFFFIVVALAERRAILRRPERQGRCAPVWETVLLRCASLPDLEFCRSRRQLMRFWLLHTAWYVLRFATRTFQAKGAERSPNAYPCVWTEQPPTFINTARCNFDHSHHHHHLPHRASLDHVQCAKYGTENELASFPWFLRSCELQSDTVLHLVSSNQTPVRVGEPPVGNCAIWR